MPPGCPQKVITEYSIYRINTCQYSHILLNEIRVQNETKKTLHGDIKYSTREDFVTLLVTVYMRCGMCETSEDEKTLIEHVE